VPKTFSCFAEHAQRAAGGGAGTGAGCACGHHGGHTSSTGTLLKPARAAPTPAPAAIVNIDLRQSLSVRRALEGRNLHASAMAPACGSRAQEPWFSKYPTADAGASLYPAPRG